MKITVEEVIEHTRAERITIPRLNGEDRDIPGERKQAIEVVVRVVDPREDIDLWRESVGRTLTVMPWKQEAMNSIVFSSRYGLDALSSDMLELSCSDCEGPAGIVCRFDDGLSLHRALSLALQHEKEVHRG